MAKLSAGLLVFRRVEQQVEVFLVHPGGPFWAKKDDGAWSLPKGEYSEGEDAFEAAKREFAEETGIEMAGDFVPLGEARQPGGKSVTAWAVEGDLDAGSIKSNMFTMEWPPRSGKMREFPEVDRGEWFSLSVAGTKILKGQKVFLDRLLSCISSALPGHHCVNPDRGEG